MDAWPESTGEAIHTQTVLGHPLGCAAALASLTVIEEENLVERAARTGAAALHQLSTRLSGCSAVAEVRGLGLMIGIEVADPARAKRVVAGCLERGIIVLPSGGDGRVISLTPPLCVEPAALASAIDVVAELLESEAP